MTEEEDDICFDCVIQSNVDRTNFSLFIKNAGGVLNKYL